jgi:hypothetical protein
MLYQTPSVLPRETVRLGLMITCRIAAEETKNLAFQKLTFRARRSEDDGSEYMKVRSLAGRLKICKYYCLKACSLGINVWPVLRYLERQKCRMLVCVAELLQHEEFVDLNMRYPSVKQWFGQPLRQAVALQIDNLGAQFSPLEGDLDYDILNHTFSDALQHALVLARNQDP